MVSKDDGKQSHLNLLGLDFVADLAESSTSEGGEASASGCNCRFTPFCCR